MSWQVRRYIHYYHVSDLVAYKVESEHRRVTFPSSVDAHEYKERMEKEDKAKNVEYTIIQV